jgi:hypothetical protein
VKSSQFTLVLGAGVSWGVVPGWDELARDLVGRVADFVSKKPQDFPGIWVNASGNVRLDSSYPLANEALMEVCWREIRNHLFAKMNSTNGAQAWSAEHWKSRRKFANLLRDCLYQNSPSISDAIGTNSTLATIADLLAKDIGRGQVKRVITFNADDWLERALHHKVTTDKKTWHEHFMVLSQPTYGPVKLKKTPIHHLHGFLINEKAYEDGTFSKPKKRVSSYDAPESLVFTEEQYWAVAASPGTFSNHSMLSALLDSTCIFIGLSMRDFNILRWLGHRSVEHEQRFLTRVTTHFHDAEETLKTVNQWRERALAQHLWLTSSPDPIAKRILEFRGVLTQEVNWGDPNGLREAFKTLELGPIAK